MESLEQQISLSFVPGFASTRWSSGSSIALTKDSSLKDSVKFLLCSSSVYGGHYFDLAL